MHRNYHLSDAVMTIFIVIIGAAQLANLAGVGLQKTVPVCGKLMLLACLLGMLPVAVASVLVWRKREEKGGIFAYTARETALLGLFAAVVVSQLLFLILGQFVYREGDMTVETVQSFLESGGFYLRNPMTGREYTLGAPYRIRILCLPALYTIVCQMFGVMPQVLVWKVAPVVVLVLSYIAFHAVSLALFPEERDKRFIFLTFVAVLMWVGSYVSPLDGFSMLFAGWRATTVRNLVLVPYTVSLSMRGKLLHALLCVLAEACITWTLYGFGVCAVVLVGIALVRMILFFIERRGASK